MERTEVGSEIFRTKEISGACFIVRSWNERNGRKQKSARSSSMIIWIDSAPTERFRYVPAPGTPVGITASASSNGQDRLRRKKPSAALLPPAMRFTPRDAGCWETPKATRSYGAGSNKHSGGCCG